MPVYNVKVKWNKETYDLELDTDEPPSVFKAQIFAMTNVNTHRQKVMFKGVVIKDDEWNETVLKSLKNGCTFLMIGSCEDLPSEPQEKVVFVEDMNENQLAEAMEMPSGLVNLGNTCYLNATIQCLSSVPELKECLKKEIKILGDTAANDTVDIANGIVVSLRDVYAKMEKSARVMPIVLLQALHMMFPQFAELNEHGHYTQQDANECLCELVKVLQQKLEFGSKNTDGKRLNFITQFFGGKLVSVMKCKEDETEECAKSVENFLQLSCFISQDVKYLQTGLKLRLEEEITKFSTKLNRDAKYLKTSKISRLPAYLTINLMRFFYKEKNAINAKILKDVKFTFHLDMYEYCDADLQKKLLEMRQKHKENEDRKAENKVQQVDPKGDDTAKEYYDYSFEDDPGSSNSGLYQLNAVLTHKGRSSSSGHYVGWIRYKNKWFKCDDELVHPVTEEEILKLSGGGDWHCAYVLIYGPQMIEKVN